MPTFGSLFAGIGGFDLGLDRAGFECKFQVEIDDYATRVLEKHWPAVPRWRDIADFIADANGGRCVEPINGRESREGMEQEQPEGDSFAVDLICGGFPCQPVSVAGRRDGMADERWLWDSFRQVIAILRPRWVLAENVPGLLSANAGRAFGTVLRDLACLGYDAEWQVLPAAAFGAPHLRKRVFIVADCQGDRWNEGRAECEGQQRSIASIGDSEPATDTDATGLEGRDGEKLRERTTQRIAGQGMPRPAIDGKWWTSITGFCRMDDGVSKRLDRGLDHENKTTTYEEMQALWKEAGAQKVRREVGGLFGVSAAEVLRQGVQWYGPAQRESDEISTSQEGAGIQERRLRGMQFDYESSRSPFGQQSRQQFPCQHDDLVWIVSFALALGAWKDAACQSALQSLRASLSEIGYVSTSLSEIQEVWRSAAYEDKAWSVIRTGEGEFAALWPHTTATISKEDKLPNRIHRLRCLGNAVVPAVTEWIGRQLLTRLTQD